MFFVIFELCWSAIHRYQILRVFFSDNQYFRMFLVSMADIIGSYERLPNDAVRAVAVAKRREYIYIYIHNYIYFVRLDFRYAVTHKHHSSETENERFSAFSASIYPAPHCGGRPPESSGSSPLFHHSLRLHSTSDSRMCSREPTRLTSPNLTDFTSKTKA